jgi:hypothetical protein
MSYRYKKIRIGRYKTMDEHRFLMEQHLGRKLEKWEEVHHIDENTKNNSLSNLEVKFKSDHVRHHKTGKRVSEKTRTKLSEINTINPTCVVLTIDQVKEVKRRLAEGCRGCDIAKEMGLTRIKVSQIKRGVIWSSVTI